MNDPMKYEVHGIDYDGGEYPTEVSLCHDCGCLVFDQAIHNRKCIG